MSALLKFLRFLSYSRCKSALILLPFCGVLTALLAATDNPSPPPHFVDVTAKAGLTSSGWGQGVCAGDYDNDGWTDLFVTYYGKNRLYHNQHGKFVEVAESAGVAGSGKAWGTGCAFVDYDRDGLLDIVVANYVDFDVSAAAAPGETPNCLWKGVPVMCGPKGLKGATNLLYKNLGDSKFKNVR